MRLGLFPLSPEKFVFFSFEVLNLLSAMTNFNALVSYATIASAVNFNTKKSFQVCE